MSEIAVGICQIRQGYDFGENLARALSMVGEAAEKGARVAILPEMFFTPYEPVSIRKSASLSALALEELKKCASRHSVMIVAGSMPWPTDGKRSFNRSYVIDERGEVIFHHDKVHLFDCDPPGGPKVTESETIVPGDSLSTFEMPCGTASVIVCYDIRFTPLTQILADRGVKILFVPAAFSLATGTAHWEMLVRMRALELQAFVVGVQPAHNPDLRYIPYGHSLIASPWGEVVLDAGQDEATRVFTIDLCEVDAIRERFPLTRHRRTDLYTTSWRGE